MKLSRRIRLVAVAGGAFGWLVAFLGIALRLQTRFLRDQEFMVSVFVVLGAFAVGLAPLAVFFALEERNS